MNNASDQELSQAIRNSDAHAFKILYERYHRIIGHFIYQRTHSVDLTRDLLQDVFTRLWIKRDRLNPSKSIKAYLYRIAGNLVIDHIRKRTTERKYSSNVRMKQPSSQDGLIELQTSIDMAVANLPEKARTVFMLSRYEGLKYVEIAEVCNISVKTVESRMSKALKLLQQALR